MTGEPHLPPDLAAGADELRQSGVPNADLLARIDADAFEVSGLEGDTLVLIWLAALVAVDAPSESYLMALGAANQEGVTVERVHRILAALVPIVGSPRVVSAGARIRDVLKAGR